MCSIQNNTNVVFVKTVKLPHPRSGPSFHPCCMSCSVGLKVDLFKSWSKSKEDAGCFVFLEVGEKNRDDMLVCLMDADYAVGTYVF